MEVVLPTSTTTPLTRAVLNSAAAALSVYVPGERYFKAEHSGFPAFVNTTVAWARNASEGSATVPSRAPVLLRHQRDTRKKYCRQNCKQLEHRRPLRRRTATVLLQEHSQHGCINY
jgi:hypothetical protein